MKDAHLRVSVPSDKPMKEWYYAEHGQRQGPVAESDLAAMLQLGRLDPDTLVWNDELEHWTAARDLEGLVTPVADQANNPAPPPPPLPAGGFVPSGEQVRPWIRYWARTIDTSVFGFAVGFVLGLAYAPALEWPTALLGVVILFIYLWIEPLMLATCGTTPGKALLRIQVRQRDGSKLSYGGALVRCLRVWLMGLGLGIPIVALFTQLHAYGRLTSKRVTSWDEAGALEVSHQLVGGVRGVVAAVILCGVFAMMIAGAMAV